MSKGRLWKPTHQSCGYHVLRWMNKTRGDVLISHYRYTYFTSILSFCMWSPDSSALTCSVHLAFLHLLLQLFYCSLCVVCMLLLLTIDYSIQTAATRDLTALSGVSHIFIHCIIVACFCVSGSQGCQLRVSHGVITHVDQFSVLRLIQLFW